jgi:putative spermidine/putrescine transport system permease protein
MLRLITVLILLFLALPIFIIIPMSFNTSQYIEFPPSGFSLQWYEGFFGSRQWTQALINSIQIGIITTLLSLILGILVAEGIYKSNFKGKGILTEIFMMPMLIPAIIIGISVFRFESELKLNGTIPGLVVAHTVLAIPFVIRTVLASLMGMNPNYELAAQNLGANKVQTFLRITLPIIKPAMFSGAMFAFATSFDEVVVSMFLCGVRVKTLPKVMWDGLNQQLDPMITSIASIMVTIISVIMIAANSREIFRRNKSVGEEKLPEDTE